MKVKILLGFVAGVALTSGVFYVASRKHAAVPVHAAAVVQTAPAVAAPPAAAPVESAAPASKQAKPVPEPPKPKVDEVKPSAVIPNRHARKNPAAHCSRIA